MVARLGQKVAMIYLMVFEEEFVENEGKSKFGNLKKRFLLSGKNHIF